MYIWLLNELHLAVNMIFWILDASKCFRGLNAVEWIVCWEQHLLMCEWVKLCLCLCIYIYKYIFFLHEMKKKIKMKTFNSPLFILCTYCKYGVALSESGDLYRSSSQISLIKLGKVFWGKRGSNDMPNSCPRRER